MDITKHKDRLIKWNLKIHIYLGLCLLFFIMLIGFSGLLLNHHWEFAKFWEDRKEIKYDKTIQISREREQYTLVNEIMNKLNLNGSIINPGFSTDSTVLNFTIAKPGTRYDIQADLNEGKINITEVKFNTWGTMSALHTLRNPTLKEQSERYQTAIASVWSISIDIASVGLIIICIGGWYIWMRMPKRKFYLGLISIASGLILVLYFLLL
jgi:hypothetical protein